MTLTHLLGCPDFPWLGPLPKFICTAWRILRFQIFLLCSLHGAEGTLSAGILPHWTLVQNHFEFHTERSKLYFACSNYIHMTQCREIQKLQTKMIFDLIPGSIVDNGIQDRFLNFYVLLKLRKCFPWNCAEMIWNKFYSVTYYILLRSWNDFELIRKLDGNMNHYFHT